MALTAQQIHDYRQQLLKLITDGAMDLSGAEMDRIFQAKGGTAVAAGDVTLSGWGSAALHSVATGSTESAGRITVTCDNTCALTGTVATANVDTSVHKNIGIRQLASDSFTYTAVTSGVSTPLATVASDIATGVAALTHLTVAVVGGHLKITSDGAYVEVDTTTTTALGSVTTATVDTSTNKTLRCTDVVGGTQQNFVVTAGATTAMTLVASDLNTQFALGTPAVTAVASVDGSGKLLITSATGYLNIDTVANGSTLSTAVGYNAAGVIAQGSDLNAVVGFAAGGAVASDALSATPTVTLTFPNGAMPAAPFANCSMAGGTGTQTQPTSSTTTTTLVITLPTTPVDTKTYIFDYSITGAST